MDIFKDGINEEIVSEILREMPEPKKDVLRNALSRNLILTSARTLEWGTLTVYKEGWYLEFFGTRVRFAVWAWDRDGKIEVGRKPAEKKLSKLYSVNIHTSEFDWDWLYK